jgi:hypothetical protein
MVAPDNYADYYSDTADRSQHGGSGAAAGRVRSSVKERSGT